MTTNNDKRAGYIAGLRTLAALLEDISALGLPTSADPGSAFPLSVHTHGRDEMAAWAAVLEDPTEYQGGSNYYIEGHIGGVHVQVFTGASSVASTAVRYVETFDVEPFLPVSA